MVSVEFCALGKTGVASRLFPKVGGTPSPRGSPAASRPASNRFPSLRHHFPLVDKPSMSPSPVCLTTWLQKKSSIPSATPERWGVGWFQGCESSAGNADRCGSKSPPLPFPSGRSPDSFDPTVDTFGGLVTKAASLIVPNTGEAQHGAIPFVPDRYLPTPRSLPRRFAATLILHQIHMDRGEGAKHRINILSYNFA